MVGIDGTPVGIKALEEGYLFGTVESDKERYSQAIFDIAWSLSLIHIWTAFPWLNG